MPNDSGIDELLKEILPKKETSKNEIEEFVAMYQEMPIFEKKATEKNGATTEKSKSLNDKLNQGINIGLNDRLAFIKHLFENNVENYTRVLSQINTMANYKEAITFIDEIVKIDYNNWDEKEEYEERFKLIIEKRFN